MKQNLPLVYTAIVAAMIFWGFSFVGTNICLSNHLLPVTLVLARLIISVVFLLLFSFIFNISFRIQKSDIKWIILLSVFEPLFYFLGETYGLLYVSPTLGAVFISTIPLFVPFSAWLIFKENISIATFAGIIISVFGVLLIMVDKNLSFNASLKGVLLMMIAVFSAVGYSMVLKHIAGSYHSITIVTWQNVIGIFLFLPIFLIHDLSFFSTVLFSPKIILTLLILGIFPSSLSYAFYTYSVKNLGVAKSSIFSNMIPVLTAMFSLWVINEPFTLQKAGGILIVIAALTLSQYDVLKIRKHDKS